MSIDKAVGRLRVDELMPGVSLEDVEANTGFEPDVGPEIATVRAPSGEELRVLREEVDPAGVYLGGGE